MYLGSGAMTGTETLDVTSRLVPTLLPQLPTPTLVNFPHCFKGKCKLTEALDLSDDHHRR